MKNALKIIALTAALFSSLNLCAFAESAGFAGESERVYAARTPYDKSYVRIVWNTGETRDAGVPIARGEFLYAPAGNKISKLSQKDGKTLSSAELDEKVCENFRGAITGNILVQPVRNGLRAVDADSMNVISAAYFGEIVTNVGVSDNYAYFGAKTDGGFAFYRADINAGFKIAGEYRSEKPPTSPALFGDLVVFAANDKLVCLSRSDGNFTENPVGAEITNVYAGKYAVFMTGADGCAYKVRLDDAGKTEDDSLMSCKIGDELTAPAEYQNRLYVGSTEGFFILDGLNMEISASYPNMKNACAPVVTLGGGTRVYTAAPAVNDGGKWYLYGILDSDEEQTVNEIAKIIDFKNGKIDVSDSGIMFFRDNPGQIWAVSVRENDILTIILKLALMAAIIVMLFIILRAWAKKRGENKPKF